MSPVFTPFTYAHDNKMTTFPAFYNRLIFKAGCVDSLNV